MDHHGSSLHVADVLLHFWAWWVWHESYERRLLKDVKNARRISCFRECAKDSSSWWRGKTAVRASPVKHLMFRNPHRAFFNNFGYFGMAFTCGYEIFPNLFLRPHRGGYNPSQVSQLQTSTTPRMPKTFQNFLERSVLRWSCISEASKAPQPPA